MASPITFRAVAFRAGHPIPRRFTKDGEDLSPALEWTDAPHGTRSFVLVVDDPDAPNGTFTHWVIYDVPGDRRRLDEGMAKAEELPGGIKQGRNDFGDIGWGGPRPPRGDGAHAYHFRLYALDARLDLPAGLDREQILDAMEGHVLAEAELTATYMRDPEPV